MAPKTNSKAAAGRARKQEQADKKAADASAKAEAAEAATWEEGSKKGKSGAESKAEKAAEAARKKAEREQLLAEEEAALPSKPANKAAPKAGAKKAAAAAAASSRNTGIDDMITTLSASNIDDALDALDLVNEKTGDKAAMGSKAAKIDTHPERRFKAAFEAYKERELPRVKSEHPGLRKQQMEEILYKEFQKAPENPFNQLHMDYNADKDSKLALLQSKRDATAERLGS